MQVWKQLTHRELHQLPCSLCPLPAFPLQPVNSSRRSMAAPKCLSAANKCPAMPLLTAGVAVANLPSPLPASQIPLPASLLSTCIAISINPSTPPCFLPGRTSLLRSTHLSALSASSPAHSAGAVRDSPTRCPEIPCAASLFVADAAAHPPRRCCHYRAYP